MSAQFQEQRFRRWYELNATEQSSYCNARGRYELAHELHAIHTEWYEREVVNKGHLGETADDGKPFKQTLEEYRQRLAEFPLLVVTRSRILECLNGLSAGIDREKLKTVAKHEGSTAFGVICNQLARGGWIRQEKTGKQFMIYPANNPPANDDVFISTELPPPKDLDDPTAVIHQTQASEEIPEGYEYVEADPIVHRPMTPELQQILDDARQAGYFVSDDSWQDGAIFIRPYFEHELKEDFTLSTVPRPLGTPLVYKSEDRGLPRGLTIWPDHMARRMDVKPWLAEDITDYAVMRSVLGLAPRPATEQDQTME
jgi:hypothetical protein